MSGLVAQSNLKRVGEVAEKCESLRCAMGRGQSQQREAGFSPDSLCYLISLSVVLRLHAMTCNILKLYDSILGCNLMQHDMT